jgi:hypothetical protein
MCTTADINVFQIKSGTRVPYMYSLIHYLINLEITIHSPLFRYLYYLLQFEQHCFCYMTVVMYGMRLEAITQVERVHSQATDFYLELVTVSRA